MTGNKRPPLAAFYFIIVSFFAGYHHFLRVPLGLHQRLHRSGGSFSIR